jgi:hypothetical protein
MVTNNTDPVSKLLKIIAAGNAEEMRSHLEEFGPIQFLENHFYEKDDVIVKYRKFADSVSAFESLSNKYRVTYVPTKHNSDEANNF